VTDSQLQILVTGLPATLGAIFAGFALLQSRKNGQKTAELDTKVSDGVAKVGVVNDKVDVLHESTNGKMQELIEASKAVGQVQEAAEQHAREASK